MHAVRHNSERCVTDGLVINNVATFDSKAANHA